jgi:hypothetical protein
MGRNFSPGDAQLSIDTDLPSRTSAGGTPVDIGPYDSVFFSLKWTGHDQNDATATLQVSRTGVDGWEDYPDSSYTLAAAAGEHHWSLNQAAAIPYARLNYVHGTVTAVNGKYSTYARVEVPPSR